MTLWSEVEGRGEADLLFVHGGFCDAEDWRPVASLCRDRYRTLLLDLPGHGRSGGKCGLAASVDAIAEILGDREPVVLVGHSLGCRLVLEASRAARVAPLGAMLVEASLMPEGASARLEAGLDKAGAQGFLRDLVESWAEDRIDPEWHSRRAAGVERQGEDDIRAMLAIAGSWGASAARPLLEASRFPILAIETSYRDERLRRRPLEPGMSSPWLDLVAQAAPDAECVILQDLGHFPHVTTPQAVAQLLLRFADRCFGAG